MKSIRLLAEQGDADAQFKIGLMYDGGYNGGNPKDYIVAYKFYSLAIAGSTDERFRHLVVHCRVQLTARMTSTQIVEAQKMADEWKPTNEPSQRTPFIKEAKFFRGTDIPIS